MNVSKISSSTVWVPIDQRTVSGKEVIATSCLLCLIHTDDVFLISPLPFLIALIPYVSNWILTNYYPVPFAFPFPSSPALQLIARMSNCDPALSWPRSRRRSAYIEMEIYLPSQWVLDFCPTVRPRCQTSIEDLEHLVFIRRLRLYNMNSSLLILLSLILSLLEYLHLVMVEIQSNIWVPHPVTLQDVLRPMLESSQGVSQ